MRNYYQSRFVVIICLISLFSFSFYVYAENKIYFIAPDAGLIREVLPEKVEKDNWYPPEATLETFSTSYITFNIAYSDSDGVGFKDASHPNRKLCLKKALEYISNIFKISGSIDILVTESENDGSGALAFAGSYVFENETTFSPTFSQQRLLTGTKPVSYVSEIELTVDFGYDYYEDPNNTTPASGQIDLVSVLIHEFTHGFGFLSFVEATGVTQQTENNNYMYTTFDQFIYKNDNALYSGSPPMFQGSQADLISNELVFKSDYTEFVYSVQGIPLYSKEPFLDGTSICHWDPDRTGIQNAVMNPRYKAGAIIREYALIDLCALKSLGYGNVQLPGEGQTNEGTNEGEGASAEGATTEGQTSEGTNEGEGVSAEGATTEGQTKEGTDEGEGINEGHPAEGSHNEGTINKPEGNNDINNQNENTNCGCSKSSHPLKIFVDFLLVGIVLLLISQKKPDVVNKT